MFVAIITYKKEREEVERHLEMHRNFLYDLYDGSLVMGNLMNAAHALGLGSCWIHRAKEVFETPEGKELLAEWGIEGDYEGIGNCIVGYSAQPLAQPAPRKPDYIHRID